MVQVQFNELARKIDKLIVQVANGETCLVIKNGKPVAEILPVKNHDQGWKRRLRKIKIPQNITAQAYIEEERKL